MSEVRKLELLERIGFPILRYKNYLENQYQESPEKNQADNDKLKQINILEINEEHDGNTTMNEIQDDNKTINFDSKDFT